MSVALITGSAGLIGSEAARYFADLGMDVVGIDNDMRAFFFGPEASTSWNLQRLQEDLSSYTHYDTDIRDYEAVERIFKKYSNGVSLVIHTAAQPSHDWAAKDPFTDFTVNANGTLNLLEATRAVSPEATFIFTSTNKVYGDLPNQLPLVELEKRWEIAEDHPLRAGIDESMSIDQSKHSLFGASKAAADILTQEYGRYFGMRTSTFRGGCLTGPNHSATQLHGFLAYLMKCTMTGLPYCVFGYKGKQVRDNIHCSDLIAAFHETMKNPGVGEVFNIGGGCESNCSMLEAIEMCQEISGMELQHRYVEQHRAGDHIWYVSDLSRFKGKYPDWELTHSIRGILEDIYQQNRDRWRPK